MSIKIGHKGETVKTLQSQLNRLGYRLTEDGVFGYTTLLAVRNFQKQKGITPDGIVGAGTTAQILLALGTIQKPESAHFKLRDFISAADADAEENGIPYPYFDNLQTLMERLERLRDRLDGQELVIRSGYRSPRFNRAVGGAGASQHLFAKAADIFVKNYAMTACELGRLIMEDTSLKTLFGGIGLGSVKNVHVDIRTVKNPEKPVVWWYQSKTWEDWGRAR